MSPPNVGLRFVFDPSALLACLRRCFAPSFELDAELLQIALRAPHPLVLPSPCVALTPHLLPKHHPLRQVLLLHTCSETREQCPPSAHRRLKALGVCFARRRVALHFPPAEESNGQSVVDLT